MSNVIKATRSNRIRSVLKVELMATLINVHRFGSIREAAAYANATPSAVSKQIQLLEQAIGRTLFIRTRQGMGITKDGEKLLDRARQFIALAEETAAYFNGSQSLGPVRLGVTEDAGFGKTPLILSRCGAAFPGIEIRLTVDAPSALIDLFVSDQLDLAIVSGGGGTIPAYAQRLKEERLVWAVKPQGQARNSNPLPLAVSGPQCHWRASCLKSLNEAGVQHQIACTSTTVAGQLAAVKADMAVAPVPESVLTSDLIGLEEDDFLPKLPDCQLALAVTENPSNAAQALSEQILEIYS